MNITLYTSTAESSRLDKSAYLTTVATLTGQPLAPSFSTISQCIMNGAEATSWLYGRFGIYFIKRKGVVITNMRCDIRYKGYTTPPSNADSILILIADINNLDLHLG